MFYYYKEVESGPLTSLSTGVVLKQDAHHLE